MKIDYIPLMRRIVENSGSGTHCNQALKMALQTKKKTIRTALLNN